MATSMNIVGNGLKRRGKDPCFLGLAIIGNAEVEFSQSAFHERKGRILNFQVRISIIGVMLIDDILHEMIGRRRLDAKSKNITQPAYVDDHTLRLLYDKP
jgi:hypothetical protein